MRAGDLLRPMDLLRPTDLLHPVEIFGPVAYSPLWLWLGIGLATLAAAWPFALWFLTRPQRTRAVAAPPRTPGAARDEARAQIAGVRRAHAAGDLPRRAAHQELSAIVRRFVADVSGWPADHMGLADLRAAMDDDQRLAGLTDYVALLQPPSFAPADSGDVDAAADRAEELVDRWAAAVAPAPEGARP